MLHVRQDIRVEDPERLIYLSEEGLSEEKVLGGSGYLAVSATCLDRSGRQIPVEARTSESTYVLQGVREEARCEVRVQEKVQLKASEVRQVLTVGEAESVQVEVPVSLVEENGWLPIIVRGIHRSGTVFSQIRDMTVLLDQRQAVHRVTDQVEVFLDRPPGRYSLTVRLSR